MFCNKCGTQLDPGQHFCPICGAAIRTNPQPQPQNSALIPSDNQSQQTGKNQYRTYNSDPNQVPTYNYYPNPETPAQQSISMWWFKFIIYFQLFVAALVWLYDAFLVFTGNIYGDSETALLVYQNFGVLKGIDIFFGILYILIAAFCIYTRFQLSGYKIKGPTLYLVLLALNIFIPLLYLVLLSTITGIDLSNFFDSSTDSNLFIPIGLFIVNIFYFKKRKYLFVN